MFISPALASAGADPSTGSIFASFLPIVLIFVVFYFFLIRPQQKKLREHRNMIENIKRGDKIVTGGGLIGKVKKLVNNDEVIIELADGVEVTAVRSTIHTVVNTAPSEETLQDKISNLQDNGKNKNKKKAGR